MHRSILSLVLAAAALSACGANRPSGLGDTTTGGSSGGSGESCGSPGTAGCACSQVGEIAACGEVVDRSNGFVSCSMGSSTCTMGLNGSVTWSACVGTSVVAKSVKTLSAERPGSLHVTALGSGTACPSGSNPCDPDCYQTTDIPDAGFDAPNGFVAGPSGLTLSGSSTVPCTGVTITPTSSSVTVTSLTATTTIGLTAAATPSGCATSPYLTTWSIDQPGQATITGTNNTNGSLVLGSPLPGTINVTAYAAGTNGSTPITVKLNIVDTTGTSPDTASTSTQSGKFYTGGTTSGTPLAGTTASTATFLYPYANTYFPLALPAPTVMYKYNAAPGTSPSSAVKLSLRYPAGTTEATSTFNYATIISEATPDPQIYVLQSAWSRFEQSARGNDASLVVQRWTGGMSGVLENETSQTIHFVNGQLKGTVYYNSYNSPQGSNTGAVLSIAPGATTPTLAVQPSSHCTVCHSLNLDGSKLIANDGVGSSWPTNFNSSKRWNMADGGAAPSPAVLTTYANGGSLTDQDATGDKFTFGGARTDGSLYMTHGGSGTGDPNWRSPPSYSNLYDPSNPGTAKTVTGWSSTAEAVTPRFSPDGSKLAFGYWGGSSLAKSPSGTLSSDTSGKTLVVVDFTCGSGCTSGWAVSNARQVTTTSSPGYKVAWPSFVPDGSAVLYQRQIVSSKAYIAWSPSDINTVGGAQADIWMSDVPATSSTSSTPTRLNSLNGLNAAGTASYLPTTSRNVSPPTAYHSGNLNIGFKQADNCTNSGTALSVYDYQLNYLPAVNPTQVGGLNWVVFTSRRMYGNIAFTNPWDADSDQTCSMCVKTDGSLVTCSSCTEGVNCTQSTPTKKLWVAALDGTFTPGTDPSHPAFYLPGQELGAGNSNGYWVNTPCAATGSSCTTSDDCCGGSGSSPTATCKITTAPSTKTCQNVGAACVASGSVCNTAGTPGDCCSGLTCPGAGGLCFNPSTIVYTQQTYTREFVGTCPSGTSAVWRYFDWLATIPTGTSIVFSAQTKQLSTDTYLPVTALGIGSATTSTSGTTWAHATNTVNTTLVAASLVSKPYLLVTMVFNPSTGGASAPTLQSWQQEYDCIASE